MAMTESELHRFDAAPYDEEELSDEDVRAVKEARSEAGIPWPEAEAELNAGRPGPVADRDPPRCP